jgi:hypothetical protein
MVSRRSTEPDLTGAPRSMKMGTTRSLWRYDAGAYLCVPKTRMVKKLRLLKGGSVPTFLVLGRCCTTSLPWTLE